MSKISITALALVAATGAALLLAVPLSAQSMVPGFVASATYWQGPPASVQVSISHSQAQDRVTAVELVLPEGGIVAADQLNTDTVTETRTVTTDDYGGGPSLGVGVGGGSWGNGWSGGWGGVGIGFGFPLGGGGQTTTTETVTKEIRTDAAIKIPDPRDYKINWSFYSIRVTMTRADGTSDVAVVGPPRP
jgi:hypothetical protein